FQAVRHAPPAVAVVRAAAALLVQQLAGDVGVVDDAGVLVLELDQTASATSIAQRFELDPAHFVQALRFPERFGRRRAGLWTSDRTLRRTLGRTLGRTLRGSLSGALHGALLARNAAACPPACRTTPPGG